MHTVETAITVPIILMSFIISIAVSSMVTSLITKQSKGYFTRYEDSSSVRASEVVRISEVTYDTLHNITSKVSKE